MYIKKIKISKDLGAWGSVLSSLLKHLCKWHGLREREGGGEVDWHSAFIGNYIYPHLQVEKGSYSKNNVVQNSFGSACCFSYKG